MSEVPAGYRVVRLHGPNRMVRPDREMERRRHAVSLDADGGAALCGVFPMHAGWSWAPAGGDVTCPRCLRWLGHARLREDALKIVASEGSIRTAAVADRLGLLPSAAYQVLDRLWKADKLSRRRVSEHERGKTRVANEWRVAENG